VAEPIYHCSLVADWAAATGTGEYTVSTRGRTLRDEGFLHASYADQVDGVLSRYYSGVTEPMVLLVIDPDRLTVPVVPESPPGAEEKFPHIYGPLAVDAVVEVRPLRRGDSGWISPSLGG